MKITLEIIVEINHHDTIIMTITMMAMINLVIAVTLMFKANPNESVEYGDGKGGFH